MKTIKMKTTKTEYALQLMKPLPREARYLGRGPVGTLMNTNGKFTGKGKCELLTTEDAQSYLEDIYDWGCLGDYVAKRAMVVTTTIQFRN